MVRQLDLLANEEMVEMLQHLFAPSGSGIEPKRRWRLRGGDMVNEDVGHHACLCGQQERLAAVAGSQASDLITAQVVQEALGLRTCDRDLAVMG